VFTGIIETTGTVASIEALPKLSRLRIEAPPLAAEVAVGESVAVNGVCLTVTGAADGAIGFDAIAETLAVSALTDLAVGSRVNLERALRAGDRLDGHIVQGHVDGVGRVRELRREGDDVRLFVDCDPVVAGYLVPKGSVAIDGVSLTVVGVRSDGFDVALIPLTLELTTLGQRREADRVNLEVDVLGKYVKEYLDRIGADGDRAPK
jgi:riboflavin synthase alpha subunit